MPNPRLSSSAFRLLPLLWLILAASIPSGPTVAVPPSAGAGPAPAGPYAPGRVIVKLRQAGLPDGSAASGLDALRRGLGPVEVRELAPGTGQYLLTSGDESFDVPATVSSLAASPEVEYASPDYLLQTHLVPSDEHYDQHQWYLRVMRAEEAWDITTGSEAIVIAGIDTGVFGGHPDLAGKLLNGFNAIRGDGSYTDDNGHGTFTAGLFGAESNNGIGIAGVCWACKILPVKILDSRGSGQVSSFASGIHWAVDNGAKVINISAGVDFPVESMQQAVRYARSKGVVVVASAGNTPDGKPRFPAGYEEVIAVGATSNNDTTTGFSSYGPYVDISAPGVGTLSTAWQPGRGATYDFENGTSASAPFVAGAAGLILSLNPGLSPEQVQAVLEATADDIETPGWDDRSGWGRLNLARALQMVRSGQIPPRPQKPAAPGPGGAATPAPPPTLGGSIIRGRVAGIAPADVQVSLSPERVDLPPRTAGVDAQGLYAFENLPAGRYAVGLLLKGGASAPAPVGVELDGAGATVREVNFNVGAGTPQQPPPGVPVPANGPRPTSFDRVQPPGAAYQGLYFAEVGHTLSGAFLAYWQKYGGLPIFGFPLSEPFTEISSTDGKPYVVQYFERNRFELHPEYAGTPNEVLLGLLGRDTTAGRVFPPGTPIAEDANHVFFKETQHSLSDAFLRYWRARGGLPVFGYPISEPVMERNAVDGKTYLVQYFERNRFELHPENAGTPHEVLLGLLGVEVLRAKGWVQ